MTSLTETIRSESPAAQDAPDGTLAQLRAKLNEPKKRIKAERVWHSAAEMWLWVCRMGTPGYAATEPSAVAQYAPNGAKISTKQQDEIKLCAAYFQHALCLVGDDGVEKEMDDAMAYDMARRDGWGPSNQAVIDRIKHHNPRMGSSIDALTLQWGLHRWVALTLHMFKREGKWEELCKRLCLTDDEIAAMAQMQEEYEVLTNVEGFAHSLGVPFGTALEIRKQQILKQQRLNEQQNS